MNPLLTKYLAYFLVLGYICLVTVWLDKDEQKLGAVPGQILAAYLEDAKSASDLAKRLLADRLDLDLRNQGLAVQAQAKADTAHEQVMLGIQHRQDLATFYFGDASHDKAAISWAAQPVPGDYLLGMCAAFSGDASGCGGHSPAGELAGSSAGGGSGAHGGDQHPQPFDHRQPAAGSGEAQGQPRQLQR